jgi:hypothetical protein
MTNTLRIKRRTIGDVGRPTSLAAAELAYNELDDTLYYGKGNNGANVAVIVIPIAGAGAFLSLNGGTVNGGIIVQSLTVTGTVKLSGLPTSNAGLTAGTLWNNGGFLCVA